MSFDLVVSAKLVPVGYGIKKLQIGCVVEDDKVSGANGNASFVTWVCLMMQRLNLMTCCRWAQTSWRRRSLSLRTMSSRWMLLLLTRFEYTLK